ncbi:MAG: arsenosugar biosynthesis radical SAM protein ArsS [Thermodesulfovibrionales bacterium]|nr:arsenosugar biosynthesis radical SAM protein ArsS [Thermodesulfovibrionales bacterium]
MEESVLKRYRDAAKEIEKSLCCPTSYNPEYLKIIPQEILEKDYGCGDPSRYVRQSETVLDLGSGAGKLCYIMAQIVGPEGKVIGVDMNDEMLSVARKYQNTIAEKLGYSNVEFKKARIQNLRLDLERVDEYLKKNPVRTSDDLILLNSFCEKLEKESPLIPDNSVDVVVSNCVLNLVKEEDKNNLFREIYRVLKPGGRAVISDIVSDEDVPEHMKKDPELWSGCISGALREDLFLKAFEDAGFYGTRILKWDDAPWKIVEGIEFRSLTIVAYKGKEGACLDKGHAVIYKGPFRKIEDDDGHVFERGKRIAVCEKTFNVLLKEPYAENFVFIQPSQPVSPVPFPCSEKIVYRHPSETKKGVVFSNNSCSSSDCCPNFEPFSERLKRLNLVLQKKRIRIIQLNLGNRCNQSCLHCHVEASPSGRFMEREIIEKVIKFLKKNPGLDVDITGGAPELHPDIEYLLKEIVSSVNKIYLRTNLTALMERTELIRLFKDLEIELIASLPDISEERTDLMRGRGVFERSIEALKKLNDHAFGIESPLHLVHNPPEYLLPEFQEIVEKKYRDYLREEYGISFTRLFVLNNMPVGRFKERLYKKGQYQNYMAMLASNFNPSTVENLMCLFMININYEGKVSDCDFNNMLQLYLNASIDDLSIDYLNGRNIITGDHCYGCTALRGSGCYGSVLK